MSAVWVRLRSELRSKWRAWVSLALIAGIAAGCAIVAAAGARRSATAYPRFLRAQDAFHAITGGGGEGDYAEHVAALKSHRLVERWVETLIVGAEVTLPARRGRGERVFRMPDAFITVGPSGTAFYTTNRAKIVSGRLPDRATIDEMLVPWHFAARHDIRVGDDVVAGIGFDPETFQPLERIRLTVVGIGAAPGSFDAIGQPNFPTLLATPALYRKYQDRLPPPTAVPDLYGLGVHLKGGAAQAYAFKQEVETTLNIDVPFIEPVITSGVQKTMRLYAAALWLVAAFVAIAGLAVVGQALARQINLDATDLPILRGMGMTRRDLFALGFVRAGLLGLIAAPIAVLVAFGGSPLMPIGAARVAEPDPGFAFDGAAIGLGAAALVVSLLLISIWPSLRAARVAGAVERPLERASRLIATATRSSSATATAGVRMALERGRGRTAVPVRSTILSVAIGIAAVTATLAVGASLVRLIDTPALAGLTYDAIVPDEDARGHADPARAERIATALRALPFVDATTQGTGLNINIDGIDSFLVAFNAGQPIGFATIEGRDPWAAPSGGLPEIALGPATMRRLGLKLGDVVTFTYAVEEGEEESRSTQRARVVGVAAIPPLPWAAIEPGEGAVMTVEALRTFSDDEGGCCFVRFKKGTDLAAARTALESAGHEAFLRTSRADLQTLERISSLPVALTAIFGGMAIAALAHVLVTGIRRRRRDLAILKTLGFVNRQVRGAVAWQSSILVALCTIAGVPAGLALGRWAWRAIADQFGVVASPAAPALFLLAVLPIALVLANVIAVAPGRAAARTQPAVVLRSE